MPALPSAVTSSSTLRGPLLPVGTHHLSLSQTQGCGSVWNVLLLENWFNCWSLQCNNKQIMIKYERFLFTKLLWHHITNGLASTSHYGAWPFSSFNSSPFLPNFWLISQIPLKFLCREIWFYLCLLLDLDLGTSCLTPTAVYQCVFPKTVHFLKVLCPMLPPPRVGT